MITDDYGNRRFYGIYRGLVTENADPTNQGRVKLRVPQVLGESVTDWSWSKDSHGVKVDPPVIGQGVWVQFEGGDPSFPVWVGTFGTDTTVLNLKLNELTDVNTAGVTNGQTIVYQSSTSSWIPGAGGGSGSGSVTSITAGTNLTGGTITSTGTIALSATPTGVTSINGVTLPTSGSFITSATTSLPNVTSVNSTTIPASSTLVTTSDTGSVTSTMLLDGTVVDADINASAAIAVTKLAASSVTINGVSTTLGNSSTVKASTTYGLGVTNSNLAFSSGTTWDGGTTGITIGLSATPTGITSINSVNMPTSGSFITSATTSLPNVTSVNSTSIPSSKTLVVTTDIGSTVQGYDADLALIAGLTTPSGTAFLKNNGSGVWSYDTNTYLTSVADATTTVKGIASFDSGDFSVSSGAVTIKSAGVDVGQGGTGQSTLTLNGVVLGNGTSAVNVTAAGSANQPLRVPSGGGAPAFGSLDISQSAVVGSSILPIANGGTNASTIATARSNLGVGAVTLSDSAPASPAAGDIWVCTLDQTEYVYFVDATPNPSGLAGQWVQIQANAAIDTALTNRVTNLETADSTSNKAGLVPVIPSGSTPFVTVGGSASMSSTGVITFAGVTTISVNNAFSSSYTNYRVIFDAYGSAGSGDSSSLSFRFRASGTDKAVDGYYQGNTYIVSNSSSVNVSNLNFGAQISLANIRNADSVVGNLQVFDLIKPAVTAPSGLTGFGQGWSTQPALYFLNGQLRNSLAYDGFSIISSSTPIYGTLTIYGYR